MPKDASGLSDWRFMNGDVGTTISFMLFMLGMMIIYLIVDKSPTVPVIIPHLFLWIAGIFLVCWEIVFISLFKEHDVKADFGGILTLKFISFGTTLLCMLMGALLAGMLIGIIEMCKHYKEVGHAIMWPFIIIGGIILFFTINYKIGKRLVKK